MRKLFLRSWFIFLIILCVFVLYPAEFRIQSLFGKSELGVVEVVVRRINSTHSASSLHPSENIATSSETLHPTISSAVENNEMKGRISLEGCKDNKYSTWYRDRLLGKHIKVWDGGYKHRYKLLCFVMTYSAEHEKVVRVMRESWVQKCDKFLFFSNAKDDELGTIDLGVEETGDANVLIEKTLTCWEYVREHYMNDYDFFLKADTDTYVIVENLRHYLDNHGRLEGGFFAGARLQITTRPPLMFNSGGAGYVLNAYTLEILICEKNRDLEKCRHWNKRPIESPQPGLKPCVIKRGNHEDVMVSRCLTRWGITPEDTRDEMSAELFHLDNPKSALGYGGHKPNQSSTYWMISYRPWGVLPGQQGVSVYSTTFHYIHKYKSSNMISHRDFDCALYYSSSTSTTKKPTVGQTKKEMVINTASVPTMKPVSRNEIKKPLIFALATYPHTGNTWIRNFWEVGTGISSEAIYPESGKWSNYSRSYGSPCGNNAGRRHRRKWGKEICDLIHRAEPNEPILVKTHYPSLRNVHGQVENFDEILDGIILTVRNPESWCKRYLNSEFRMRFKTMEECVPGMKVKFEVHNKWWTERYSHVPIHTFNYTLMKYDKAYTEECLNTMLNLTGAKLVRNPWDWYPSTFW